MCTIVLLLFACNVLLYMLTALMIKLITANITNPVNTSYLVTQVAQWQTLDYSHRTVSTSKNLMNSSDGNVVLNNSV